MGDLPHQLVEHQILGHPNNAVGPKARKHQDGSRVSGSIGKPHHNQSEAKTNRRHDPKGEHFAAEAVGTRLLPHPALAQNVGRDGRQHCRPKQRNDAAEIQNDKAERQNALTNNDVDHRHAAIAEHLGAMVGNKVRKLARGVAGRGHRGRG